MIDTSRVDVMEEYAVEQITYKEMPTGDDYTLGVIPEQIVPAEWWNAFFSIITKNITQTNGDINNVLDELKNFLSFFNVTPDADSVEQLKSTLSTTAIANTIAVRDTEGKIRAIAGTDDNHVVNKGQLDAKVDAVDAKVDTVDAKVDTVDAKEIYKATYVVDSQAKFTDWVNNASGNDYTHVYIASGTYTSSTPLNLTTTGTKTIQGCTSERPKLTFSNCEYGVKYEETPTTNDYFINDIEVYCSNTTTGTCIVCGIQQCTNLSRCTGTGTGTGAGLVQGKGFQDCTNLSRCTGIGTGIGTGISASEDNAQGYGFYSCINLSRCTGTGTGTDAVSVLGYGFSGCISLSNCTGAGTYTNPVPGSDPFSGRKGGCGFSGCLAVRYCKKSTPSSNATFSNCLASYGHNSTYLVEDTPEGGFNTWG